MMFRCPKCGRGLAPDARFCDMCGIPVPPPAFCGACGEKLSPEFAFCPSCGNPVPGAALREGAQEPPTKKRRRLPVLAAILSVILAGAILLGAVCLAPGARGDWVLYIKDNNLTVRDLKGKEEKTVTRRLMEPEALRKLLLETPEKLTDFITLSEDGSLLFYPDGAEGSLSEGCTVYYTNLREPAAPPVKLDSEIRSYAVGRERPVVTYLRGPEGELCQYYLKTGERERIALGVTGYHMSADGDVLWYRDLKSCLAMKKWGREKEILAEGVSEIYALTEDSETVYYRKGDTLCRQRAGKKPTVIAGRIDELLSNCGSGKLYYIREEEKHLDYRDFLEDDTARNPWKLTGERAREELRKGIRREDWSYSTWSLWYYNGREEVRLTDDFAPGSQSAASGVPALAYSTRVPYVPEKIPLSQVTSLEEIWQRLPETLHFLSEGCVALEDRTEALEEGTQALHLSSRGTELYYFTETDARRGTLTRRFLGKNRLSEPEAYENDVLLDSVIYGPEGHVLYFKQYDDRGEDLYLDGRRLDRNVHRDPESLRCPGGNGLLYMTDWDPETETGTLRLWQSGRIFSIDPRVKHFAPGREGSVLYLREGELRIWARGRTRTVAENVDWVVPLYTAESSQRGEQLPLRTPRWGS